MIADEVDEIVDETTFVLEDIDVAEEMRELEAELEIELDIALEEAP